MLEIFAIEWTWMKASQNWYSMILLPIGSYCSKITMSHTFIYTQILDIIMSSTTMHEGDVYYF